MSCRIAVPITSPSPPLEAQVRAAQSAGADLIELRVDAIGDVAAVEALLATPHAGRFILTIRSAAEGGHWDGDDADRIALYERLGLLLPGYIDVELATWRRSANLRQKLGLVCRRDGAAPTQTGLAGERPKNHLILSHHNWRETPPELDAIFDELASTPAAIIKGVFSARDARDALRILGALRRSAAARPTIALGVGPAGLATRVLARKFGAFLTFAAATAESASAPGQPLLADLLGRYHWGAIAPTTRVYGVVGWPVGHSRSPELHNAALAQAGIDGVYLPLPVLPDEPALGEFLDQLAAQPWLDFAGLSVTLPHKEHAYRWLLARGGARTPLAERCRAVNTLTQRMPPDGPPGWHGDNTDASAFATALAEASWAVGGLPLDASLANSSADVLGAGGIARAVAATLRDRGCRVMLYNRTESRAAALANELGCTHAPWDGRLERTGRIVVNCTSVGLTPHADETPLPAAALRGAAVVFDTIYTPPETRLLREARAAGCRTVSGVELFLRQAAAQFALWHGRAAPWSLWRAALGQPA